MSLDPISRCECCVRMACLLEATAHKPGNVSPKVGFDDLTYDDFVRSADVIAPILARTADRGVGQAILDSVRATKEQVGRNTNLGIILLLAPLAAVPSETSLTQGITALLAGLTVEDAVLVYEAIRLAEPGGMGRVSEQDVAQPPTRPLTDVMRLATDRDTIAREYATGFSIVLEFGVPKLAAVAGFPQRWEQTIVELHLALMAEFPDTLIARKCGRDTAMQSAAMAQKVLEAGGLDTPSGSQRLEALDTWLRADGHRRNPGTTADLVTACLFAAFRDGHIAMPEWPTGAV